MTVSTNKNYGKKNEQHIVPSDTDAAVWTDAKAFFESAGANPVVEVP